MSNNHVFTLEEVLNGKATKIRGKEYLKTGDYINPFLDKMSKYTSDFRVEVKEPDQITIDDTGDIITDDLTFNRVWIQAVLPTQLDFANHQEVIGMVLGLDCRKPICKLYRGGLNMACTNLCVFRPSALDIQEVQPETALDFTWLDNHMQTTSDIANTLRKLVDTPFICNETNLNESLGQWIRNSIHYDYVTKYGKVKFAVSDTINAYKLLFENTDSPYFTNMDEEINLFQVYNAFTQIITDDKKDIINHFEKTLVIKSILGF